MIELAGVSYRYGPDRPALRFPDACIPAGTCVLVRGDSGCGKSTLLALVAGLLTADTGQVRVDGVDVGALAPRARDAWRAATLGFVPQRLHLSEALDVAGNVALAAWAAGAPRAGDDVDAVLDRLGIAALRRRRPHQLSVGQAQRVAVARALVRRPRLLLADEPTASLDDGNSQAVLSLLLAQGRASGATLVISTHDRRVREMLGEDCIEVCL